MLIDYITNSWCGDWLITSQDINASLIHKNKLNVVIEQLKTILEAVKDDFRSCKKNLTNR